MQLQDKPRRHTFNHIANTKFILWGKFRASTDISSNLLKCIYLLLLYGCKCSNGRDWTSPRPHYFIPNSINIMIRKFSEYIHDFYNFKQSWAEGKSL